MAQSGDENNAPPPPAGPDAPTVTSLERRWLVRMIVLFVLFGGFAVWGLYDATVAYPARGRAVADDYLLDALKMKVDQPAWRTAVG